MTSYTRTLLTRHRERANFFLVLQRIRRVCAHRSAARSPAASACAQMSTRGGSPASGDTQSKEASQSDQGHPNAASQQVEPLTRHPVSRCSSSKVARRQCTPKMVPVLRAQADALGKGQRRSGRTMRAAVGSVRAVGAYTVHTRLQASHLWAEVTLITPRAARSTRGAGGHGDSHGRRLEELRLLVDDLR